VYSGPSAILGLAALLSTSAALAAPQPAMFRDTLRGGGKGPVMIALPGGPVQLGDTRRAITLSPFAIARDDVTNAEFAAFLDQAGEVDPDGVAYLIPPERGEAEIVSEPGRHRVARGRERLPVTGVSWRGAIAYAQWLSRRTGRRYFLPTEAQWEYAARADSASAYPWGETFDPAKANCGAPPEAFALKVVGSYPANAFGLNDMVGNVWQWAADCFPTDPDDLARHDPSGYAANCVTPSIRGGAAPNAEALCKPTFRVNYWWRGAAETIGFRVVRLDVRKGQGA
jgi:formylglycine-generating enzyme required for sulfatase activity